MPVPKPVEIQRNRSFSFRIRVRDKQTGAATDVSTWVWAAQLRPAPGVDDAVDMVLDDADAATGEVRFRTANDAVTAEFPNSMHLGVDVTINSRKSQLLSRKIPVVTPVEPGS